MTHEFLEDLAGTHEFRKAANDYVSRLESVFENASPEHFFCSCGAPLRLQFDWPIQQVPQHASSFLRVRIANLRDSRESVCNVIMTRHHDSGNFSLRKNPFLRLQLVVNTVRRGVDDGAITFYSESELPSTPQELSLDARPASRTADLAAFIEGKTYWLGFKQGDRRTAVWIADDRDASYLGVSKNDLVQQAQISEASDRVAFDEHPEFARAGKALLQEAYRHESKSAASSIGEPSDDPPNRDRYEFDVAISFAGTERAHAERLANLAQNAGFKVFYDGFYKDQLWGKDLAEFFDGVYRKRSRYCVMFICTEYARRAWTIHERRSAIARMVEQRGKEYILPIRCDETDLPGLPPTICFFSLATDGIEAIAQSLVQKLSA